MTPLFKKISKSVRTGRYDEPYRVAVELCKLAPPRTLYKILLPKLNTNFSNGFVYIWVGGVELFIDKNIRELMKK